ncbi:uncharacterized protein LOC143365056, partial [Halictus rubicundus]|uniref:uncharacterized protein LOC143365056 n=1 Tax=Halictus rubicundus TaxID=77578 RepID=UPI004036C3BF
MASFPHIITWNAQSVVPKRNEIIANLDHLECDILLVTETWLNPQLNFSIPGYSVIRKDRAKGWGGVAIIINNKIKFTVVRAFTDLEFLAIRLDHPSILIGVAYFRPHQPPTETDLTLITHFGSPFIIGGDWNSKHRFWNNVHSPYSFKCDALDHFGTAHRSVSLKKIAPTDPSSGSLFHMSTDWDKYRESTLAWSTVSKFNSTSDIDQCIDTLNSFLLGSLRDATTRDSTLENSPSATRRKAVANDDHLTSLIKARRKLRKLYQISNDPYFNQQSKEYTRLIKIRISDIRQKAWVKMLQCFIKPDPTFWATYQSLAKKRNFSIPVLEVN